MTAPALVKDSVVDRALEQYQTLFSSREVWEKNNKKKRHLNRLRDLI